MARLILPGRLAQQPQYAPPIDRQGLGKGVQILFNPAIGPVDLVTGRIWTPNGTPSITVSPQGKVLNFKGGASNDGYRYTGYPELAGNSGTFFMWAPTVGAADTFGHIFLGNSTSSALYFQVAADSTVYAFATQSTGTISWFSSTNRSLILRSDGTNTSTKAYLDGIDTGLTWAATPSSWATGSKDMSIGGYPGGPSWDFDGTMLVVGYTTQVWGAAEARAFHDSKGLALFKAPARRLWAASAAAGTVALTGQSITSSQGTLAPATSIALTGQSLTSSQGTIAPGTSKALSGQALTASQGSLTPNTSVPLSGQSATSAQGTLSVSGSADVTLALSGQALTSAQGTLGLTKSGSVALSGQQATTAQGTLAAATTVSASGQALTSSQGTLAPATTVALSGQTLTSSQGTLAAATTVALSGQQATTAQGTLAPSATGQSITIQLTGQSLVSGQGSLSLDQYIWDTSQGRAQPGRGTFRPLKPDELSKPEIVVVDIPEEESTYEHHPVSDVKPIKLGPRAGITGIKLPPRRHPGATPAPVQSRDYKALMARAGTPQKTMKLSDFPVKQNKKYLTKTRGPVTLKGN